MEDQGIIRLYFNRDQEAIRQTDRKYGRQCRRTARNILAIPEDAEECVNDTYLAAWNTIPPERPRTLGAYLGRIIRNLSISRYRANHAQKRYAGLEAMLSNWRSASPAGRMWKRNWNAGNWERFSAAGWTPSPGRSGTSSSGGTGTARRCRIWPGRRASPPTRPPSGFSACGGCCEPCWNRKE